MMMMMKERYTVEHLHAKEVDAYCGQTKEGEHREEERARIRKTSSLYSVLYRSDKLAITKLFLPRTKDMIGTPRRAANLNTYSS